jgi:hypothetical protein
VTLDRSEWDLDALASEILKIMPLPDSEDLESLAGHECAGLADHLSNSR